jgi:hypothetical protein
VVVLAQLVEMEPTRGVLGQEVLVALGFHLQ